LLELALKIFADRKHFVPEKARVVYKRAKLFSLLGRQSEAQDGLREALSLLRKVRPATSKRVDDLEDADFDRTIIMVWSR
jgi:hypothetical protein